MPTMLKPIITIPYDYNLTKYIANVKGKCYINVKTKDGITPMH